jgi:hypothetical protein
MKRLEGTEELEAMGLTYLVHIETHVQFRSQFRLANFSLRLSIRFRVMILEYLLARNT